MESDLSFLKFFITEDLYLVKEKSPVVSEVNDDVTPYHSSPELPKKELLVVLEELSDQHNETLRKLLKAIKVQKPDFATSRDEGYAKYLVFGDDGTQKYQVLENNEDQVLYADSLKTLEGNTSLKRQLWDRLQEMFLE